jgi:hypothetical protein
MRITTTKAIRVVIPPLVFLFVTRNIYMSTTTLQSFIATNMLDTPPIIIVNPRQQQMCNDTVRFKEEWVELCNASFIQAADDMLLLEEVRQHVHVVQIGAHTGFEKNDPFTQGMAHYINMLSQEERGRFHWTFVEPSPANYKSLEHNIATFSHLCNMTTVNAAVVSDTMQEDSIKALTFHSVRDTIDPVTGYDSLSGKTFPFWITQVSIFRWHRLTLTDVCGINWD